MNRKSEIITFKADEALVEALDGIANRSEFIRDAVLAALENTCPLCGGSGILTANQQRHWQRFARDHAVQKCRSCHELHLVCSRQRTPASSAGRE